METDNQQSSVLAPTTEDYKRMWEQEHLAKANRIDPEVAKRQAIKEILQEQVKNQVKADDRLINIFNQQIGR